MSREPTGKEYLDFLHALSKEYEIEAKEKGHSWRKMNSDFWAGKVWEEAIELVKALENGELENIQKEGVDLALIGFMIHTVFKEGRLC